MLSILPISGQRPPTFLVSLRIINIFFSLPFTPVLLAISDLPGTLSLSFFCLLSSVSTLSLVETSEFPLQTWLGVPPYVQ